MIDIIAKLEAATEGSRELDCMIWCELNGKRYKEHATSHRGETHCFYTEPPKRTPHVETGIPPWTQSIDAALTLVPKGYDWIISNVNGHFGGTPYACVEDEMKISGLHTTRHFANTPVLALCIASLRARGECVRDERKRCVEIVRQFDPHHLDPLVSEIIAAIEGKDREPQPPAS